ncbi:MAG: hypothetical protein NTV43_01735 [Methylococcales bacterium]|nr:hypothetical protein [Methylococcales bacterium]
MNHSAAAACGQQFRSAMALDIAVPLRKTSKAVLLQFYAFTCGLSFIAPHAIKPHYITAHSLSTKVLVPMAKQVYVSPFKACKQPRIRQWLWAMCLILPLCPAVAKPPVVGEVLAVLGMDKGQIAELAQGQPITYGLSETSDDELAVGLVWYLPVPLETVTGQLRQAFPDPLDLDVTAHGLMTEQGGDAGLLVTTALNKEAAQTLLDAAAGDDFNLSSHEIDSFKHLKQSLKQTPYRPIEEAVGEQYRELLWQRFKAYKRGGMKSIAPYARDNAPDSKPALELRQAAQATEVLARYFPALHKAWLDYPKALPAGAVEVFPWLEKNVEGRSAAILRHRVDMDWDGGVLVLTRELYASHSFNASQWITGCLPYLGGTVIFQQVRSYTDQVAGAASDLKHVIGRKVLKDKMRQSFERLCGVLGQCQ